jgi:hypothetical protein
LLNGWIHEGYRKVAIWYDGDGWRQRKVHQLVAEAFLGSRPEGARLVRHLDDDRLNNVLANIAWGNDRDNSLDAVRNGCHPTGKKTHCKRGHPFSPENTYIRPSTGQRQCRTCYCERARRWREQRKVGAA